MTPRYEALKQQLVEDMLSRFSQPRETLSIPYLLKGQCRPWAEKFVEAFPELTAVAGFFAGHEHYWCVEPDGTIVDPTVEQFCVPTWGGDPTLYRVYDPDTDKVFLGRCMNCGDEIYGLMSDGHKSICPDSEERSCATELEAYYDRLTL